MSRKAFSLIELSLVLVLLSLLGAAVAINLQGPLHRASLQDVLDQLREFDSLSRVYAREHGLEVALVVDLNAGRLRRSDDRLQQQLGRELCLPPGYRIARLLARSEDLTGIGSLCIPCSPQGFTPTYAILIETPAHQRQWLLVAGLSGQCTVLDTKDEGMLKELFVATAAGPDAG